MLGIFLWITRYVSLSTVAAAAVVIVLSFVEVDDRTAMLLCVFMGLAVLIKHIPAMLRIRKHTELKLSFEKDISYKFDEKF